MLECSLNFLHLIFGHSLDYLLLLSGFMLQHLFTCFVSQLEAQTFSIKQAKNILLQKITIFVIISLAHGIDYLLGKNDLLRNTTICFYIAHEAIQTLENATHLHVLIPIKLKEAIKHLLKLQEDESND
ncbi:phage holin family protein [Vagococcus xieshaowenii]|uniref:Holin n=1 Tax=Vagococcus xieshaowenii TaxID=2562451 RepID=A0AAJ5JLQ0_9ENTE|nr:phage holin family protein [Vagococcus xieshaowenii]QCA29249.1 holin [Vagococcus xieshaowenii]TFZ43239.1 holin [Vagococcus xieshaowenii]